MAAHPASCWCPDCVNRLRSELDEDVMASTVQSGISLDRRGYVRPAAEDRPGVRSPFSEGICTPPEDMAAASDDSSPALRESELGHPTQNAPCVSCELLRTEIAALRNELHLARSAEFNAVWDALHALHALQARVSDAHPTLECEHFSLVFTAIQESAGARLLRDPVLTVRCLRYHERPGELVLGDGAAAAWPGSARGAVCRIRVGVRSFLGSKKRACVLHSSFVSRAFILVFSPAVAKRFGQSRWHLRLCWLRGRLSAYHRSVLADPVKFLGVTVHSFKLRFSKLLSASPCKL